MDLSADDPVMGPVKPGDLLWTPSPERVASANITAAVTAVQMMPGTEWRGW